MSDKDDNSDSAKSYVKYSSFVAQMGVTIFLGAYLGKWLDETYPSEKKWFTMICTVVSVTLSLFVLIRQLNKHNNK